MIKMKKRKNDYKKNQSDEWYSDDKLHGLLEHYVGGDHINVTGALSSIEQLNNYLQQLAQQPNTTELLKSQHIIPLNVSALTGELGANNNHWVGLHIFINSSNNSVTVKYIDPMGRAISYQIQSIIKQQLEKNFTSVIIDQPLLNNGIQYVQQTSDIELSGNIDDCGPMLIYIMTCLTRIVDPIKISSYTESVSLGNYLRDSFEKKTDFNEIYATFKKNSKNTSESIENTVNDNDKDSVSSKEHLNSSKVEQNNSSSTEPSFLASEKTIAELEKKLFPEWNLDKEHKLPDSEKERATTLAEIKQSHTQAIQYFKAGVLKKTEQELVKVLRPTLSKPSMKNLYVKTEDVLEEILSAMYHLGLVYLQDSDYFNHHAKAACIFQYCAGFAAKHKIKLADNKAIGNQEYFIKQAYLVEKEFLTDIKIGTSNILEKDYLLQSDKEFSRYKNQLKQVREKTKIELKKIENLSVKEIAERADAVEKIYQDCGNFFVNHDKSQDSAQTPGLVQRLLADCYKQLGPIPEGCERAIIGLGSLSTGTITPWSDLEFAILVNDAKHKEYFRNLTKLLHIKIINLGETHLKSMGVESLNNFKTGKPEDEWFWDDVIKIKFNFDSARWDACKVPLGRQGSHKVKKEIILTKPDYELILTPDEMAAFQREEVPELKSAKNWFETDKHLVQALRTVSWIDGSQELLDNYRTKALEAANSKILQDRALQILQEDVNKFSLKLGNKEEGKLIDTKQEIYRLGDRVINGLANYYNIASEKGEQRISVWHMLDKMENKGILSQEGMQHLKEATCIATELRLKTYSNNDTREEMMSTFVPAVEHLTTEQKHQLIEETFHFQDTEILHHFYYVMLKLQDIVQCFCNEEYHEQAAVILSSNSLFDPSNYNKGMVHARFLEYDRALEYMKTAKEEEPKDSYVLEDLFFLYLKTKTIEGSITVAKEMLELAKNKYKEDPHHPDIAASYNNLGNAYMNKGEYEQAINYHQQTLAIMLKAYEQSPNHPSISGSYNNLGLAYADKGEYEQAINYYQQALEMRLKTYEKSPKHLDIAICYNNLGLAYLYKGEYEQAINYHQKAVEIMLKAYEKSPNHPSIAASYNNLGLAYTDKGEYEQAINYYQQAVKIQLKAYEQSPNHPDIATSYCNLGSAYADKGEYEQAINYHKQALKIYEKAYEQSPNHPDIAASYNNLGIAYRNKGEYEQAINYHQQAVEIRLKTYEKSPNHPSIAMSYDGLGSAHKAKGEYDKAINYYQQAVEIQLKAYEQSRNHPDIAKSYNNLGIAYMNKGEYEQAINYHQKALEIRLKAYEQSPNHPDIATSYCNLGSAYASKGEDEQAINYHQKALEIMLKTYEKSPNHPGIAGSYNNLGGAYADKGEYEQAINYYQQAVEIQLKAYEQSPNHPDIAMSYNNLGTVYQEKGEYEQACFYSKKALEIYSNSQAPQYVSIAQTLYTMSLLLLGNLALLKGNIEKTREYYKEVDPAYEQINFNSVEFIDLQLECVSIAYENNCLLAAINCQKVLVKFDPELKHGNHYHNLACYYACQGNVKEANDAFINALTHPNAKDKVTGGVYAEYAQFLIVNKDSDVLNIASQVISKQLYAAINCDNMGGLQYGKIEQDSICDILQNLIKQKNATISINPKVFAYYLLTTHPEYIKNGDSIENLLALFGIYCDNLQDEISFHLLSETYKSVGNEELAIKYSKSTELIQQIDKVIDGKLKLDDDRCIIHVPDIQKYAETLDKLAFKAVLEGRLDHVSEFYTKAFQIYSSVLTDQPEQLQSAIDKLATVSLLTGDLQKFIALKFQFEAELNQDLIKAIAQTLYTMSLLLLGNLALLKGNIEKTREYYKEVDPAYEQINFNSVEFIDLQLECVSIAYENNCLLAAINCQKVLVKFDPELKHGNHYHNLACYYACQGNVKEANDAFINALTHPNAKDKVTGGVYAEYAQFLIVNKDSDVLNIASQVISKQLYAAINCDNMGGLQYGKIEQDSICDILQNLIKQKNATISINPKVFAYYLLTTHPEYIKNGDSIENLLALFGIYCDNLQDEISFHLLSETYKSVGNDQKALEIQLKAYEQSPNHPNIAASYNNLGLAYADKGEYEQAINYLKQALKIYEKAYEQSPNHPNIAMSYNNLGNAYADKGEYEQAINYHQQALQIKLKAYEQSPNHPDIAASYNNLGLAYSNKGEYDKAIDYHQKAVEIKLIAYEQCPNHPDIATSYNNLGNAYKAKGEYEQARFYSKKALEIYSNCQAHQYVSMAKNLYNMSLLLLGNLDLLEGDEEKARKYYKEVDPAYEQITFNSIEFIKLQFQYRNLAYESNLLLAAINCQKVLLKVDPELKYDNHYHNLSCFYACQGNVKEANDAFINALTHPNAKDKVTGGLYAEYAQFLIVNKDNDVLNVTSQEISKQLYAAINCHNMVGLQYGKMQKNSTCEILQNLIKQKNATISINPKVLAYYLLTTHPECIKDGDSIEKLLALFRSYCDNLQDEKSFHLLSDGYKSIGNEKLAKQYSKSAELIEQIDKVIDGKLKLDDDKCIIHVSDIQKYALNLDKLAFKAVLEGRLDHVSEFYTKAFQIYSSVLTDQPKQLQSAIDKLATVSLLTGDLQKFIDLKFECGSELNHDLIKSLGHDINSVIAIEQQIIKQVMSQLQKVASENPDGQSQEVLSQPLEENINAAGAESEENQDL